MRHPIHDMHLAVCEYDRHGSNGLPMVSHELETRLPIGILVTVQCEGFGDPVEIVAMGQREHRCASNSIGNIVVSVPCMVNVFLSAATRDGALQADDLRQEAVVARQRDASAVEEREQVDVKLALRFLRGLVADAAALESFRRKAAGVAVADDFADAILLQQWCKFRDDLARLERWPLLANAIDDDVVLFLVADCQCEGVFAAARGNVNRMRGMR